MLKAKVTQKMINFYDGNVHEVEHFLKVHQYAKLIGTLEGFDDETLETLEIASIVHDIACPTCREKYGNCDGKNQEKESEALLRPFLEEFALKSRMEERIVYLVTHHHTVTDIDGDDYQALIEADFLVNASEMGLDKKAIIEFKDKVAKTVAGKELLTAIYKL